MKQFTMEQIKDAKAEAARFGIKVVARKNVDILDELNAALKSEFEAVESAKQETVNEEEVKEDITITDMGLEYKIPAGTEILALKEETPIPPAPQEEVKPEGATLESFGFQSGEIAYITGRQINGQKTILANRKIMLTKVSKKPGMFNGQLIHEKTGAPQKCEIAIPIEVVIKLEVETPAGWDSVDTSTELQEAQ